MPNPSAPADISHIYRETTDISHVYHGETIALDTPHKVSGTVQSPARPRSRGGERILMRSNAIQEKLGAPDPGRIDKSHQ